MNARLAAVAACLVLTTPPLLAHHSFSAEYQSTRIALSGTVTKIEWLNPHARFYVDVKDDTGKVVPWEFELASPNQLRRRGWTRDSLKIGDAVTIDAYPAKDGAHLGNARMVTLADGKKVFSVTAEASAER